MVAQAKADLTIRTALLEGALRVGRPGALRRGRAPLLARGACRTPSAQFVAEKLAERDARHKRMGDSRYVVEPNVKEGKGGLRDLQTLFWIGKYVYNVRERRRAGRRAGCSPREEYRQLPPRREFPAGGALPPPHDHRARRGPADLRPAARDRRADAASPTGRARSRSSASCSIYFLQAKTVGDLTGVFLAHLDEKFAARGRALRAADALRAGPRKLKGFVLDRGRLGAAARRLLPRAIRCG